MANESLTGIERELVLQYLIDGNVPVTLTPISDSSESSEGIKSISSQVFPVALKPDHFTVKESGKIILENPNQSVIGFAGKTVKVEFYFNRVGLYFESKVLEEDNALALILPETIERIKDELEVANYDFSAQLYFECKNKKDLNIQCIPWDNNQIFNRPMWKDIPLENQKNAKEYLEEFVEAAKKEKNVGNGIQLIPVCNFLTFKENKISAVENRIKPFYVLYIDHERIVFGLDNPNEKYFEGNEYGIKMSFSIKNSPILSRDIFVTCIINKIYQTEENKVCLDCIYTSIQEEDTRYLYEKATKKHFI